MPCPAPCVGINGSAFSFRKSRCVRFFLRELYWGNQGQSKGGRRKPDRARPSAAACDGQTSAAQDSAFLFSAGPPHLPPGAGPTPVPTWSRSVQVGKHQCSFLPGALNRRPLYPTPLPTSILGGAWGALPSWRRAAGGRLGFSRPYPQGHAPSTLTPLALPGPRAGAFL